MIHLMRLGLFAIFVSVAGFATSGTAHAYTNSRLMDDQIFDNAGTMSESQIQTFLAAKGPCLANYSDVDPNPNFDTSGNAHWSYTGSVSAAHIIYKASQQWVLNPQVIIATLQKEESLITGTSCDAWRYNSAMGYGCPDSGGCNAAYAGFTRQVLWGSWQLKFNKERSYGNTAWDGDGALTYVGYMTAGNRKRCDSCTTFAFDGNATIDGQVIHLDNGTTASLYTYTPHLGQALPGVFESYFGPTLADAYSYSFVSSSQATIWTHPGQSIAYNTILIKNTGSATWYPDGNTPIGQHPTRLSLKGYQNTPYADTTDLAWLGTRNQLMMTDPTISVPPGEYARFTFRLKAPYQLGSFVHSFVPVVDGVGFMRDTGMQFVLFTTAPTYAHISHTIPPSSLLPGDTTSVSVTLMNNGQAAWYADGAVPPGGHPMRLASYGYINTPYANTADPAWLGTQNQVKMAPSVVNPGENATFSFTIKGPYATNQSTFHFLPVLDGVTALNDLGMSFSWSTPAPIYSYQYITATNPPLIMAPGSTVNVSLTLRNTGNIVWANETTRQGLGAIRIAMTQPYYRNSSFYDYLSPTWLAPNQIGMTTSSARPGDDATFNFTWRAPSAPGIYSEHFAPVLDGVQFFSDAGMTFSVKVQ